MLLSTLKPNPDNPRNIKDEKFRKLVEQIRQTPKFLVLKPIIYDDDRIIIGGNQRFHALEYLGYTEIPDEWTKAAKDLTPEERKKFIVIDNLSYGEDDWELLGQQYKTSELEEWGLDVPTFKVHEKQKIETKPFTRVHVLLSFPPEKLLKIQGMLEKIIAIDGVEYEQSAN